MVKISLKRLLAKKEVSSILSELLKVTDTPISIQDVEGEVLLDNLNDYRIYPLSKYPIELAGQVIGWVIGGEKASPIASVLTHLAKNELEKKALARETLDKYKELNLLYNSSGRMAACLELTAVAKLVLEEARRLIAANSGSVMLVNEQTGKFDVISAFGQQYDPKAPLEIGQGIAGNVVLTGRGEIVNEVFSDHRFVKGNNRVNSLICVPLKIQDKSIGVINISTEEVFNYTAGDFKLFMALASQASSAIENAILHENKLRQERIKSNLERYVNSKVVEAILNSQEEISLAPAKMDITILFSDIRNFTTKCEELEPEKIVEYLNEYFTHMVEVIFSNGGTVNKFVGDMIVAMFGAPSKLVDSERRAIETAIKMQNRIKEIPVPWIRNNFITGIGISSGEVVVGNVGSPQHMDYTAIGDKVNIASRLQSIAKGEQILVSRSIYDVTKDLFEFKEVGYIKVKGKKEAIEVFEVIY